MSSFEPVVSTHLEQPPLVMMLNSAMRASLGRASRDTDATTGVWQLERAGLWEKRWESGNHISKHQPATSPLSINIRSRHRYIMRADS